MIQPRFVLINTSHPGNIGAVARAMKNMGLQELHLVEPQQFPSAEATARASGADDLLAAARCYNSLDDAIGDAVMVIGASARSRTLPMSTLDPRACAALVAAQAEPDRTAILFGRERTGLTNEELDRCHYLVQIPANPDYPSLNIAAAAQVLAYELRMTELGQQQSADEPLETDFATDQQLEQFYEHLQQTLVELEFLDPRQPKHLMRRLRRLFTRARLDQKEVNILRGILTAAGKKTR
ncbi:MAG: RNA methyltransferase [Thiogranum sp.]|nr:RNA methyltransferase [Thiogranum sp.]